MLEDTIILLLLIIHICRYIDEGHNPELFTRHQLKQTLADHEAVQRKVKAYKVSIQLMNYMTLYNIILLYFCW